MFIALVAAAFTFASCDFGKKTDEVQKPGIETIDNEENEDGTKADATVEENGDKATEADKAEKGDKTTEADKAEKASEGTEIPAGDAATAPTK